jgi:hypothetical protein
MLLMSVQCVHIIYRTTSLSIGASLAARKTTETEKLQQKYGFGPKLGQNGARTRGLARITSSGPEKLGGRPVLKGASARGGAQRRRSRGAPPPARVAHPYRRYPARQQR